MCLLVLAWAAHPRYRLVLAANRDEFHARPAAALGAWPAAERLLGGRDLQAGGTWLALDRARRLGVVTNYRELQPPRPQAPSRGELVPRFLAGGDGAAAFFEQLAPRAHHYAGFNLLLADGDGLWYGSNRGQPFARALAPGVYGLANEQLDSPWPKLARVRAGFDAWLAGQSTTAASGTPPDAQPLFTLLADRTAASDAELSHTGGLPPQWARPLSAPFVVHPQYGTRCSTVVFLAHDGTLDIAERRFDADGAAVGETAFALRAAEWP